MTNPFSHPPTSKTTDGQSKASDRRRKTVATGTVHKLPDDLRKALISTPAALKVWEDITPLARNEWICWVISGIKAETRDIRIKKGLSKLKGGMRRPCCWVGCTHR